GQDGRAVMLGRCRAQSLDPDEIFTGLGYAPAVLSDLERNAPPPLSEAPLAVRCDVPDWVLPLIEQSLGGDVEKILARMRERAPVFLRANTLKCSRDEAVTRLTSEGFDVRPHILANTAIVVAGNARTLAVAGSLRDGLVEFQDVSSQAVIDRLAAFLPDANVLDFCAGGGGKALAMAAHNPAQIVAHDINSARMGDIEPRAARAGANIATTTKPEGVFDLVVCDAPCSGSGAWRRQPDAKWRFDLARLDELTTTQSKILLAAKEFVRPCGHMAYITCSFFNRENDDRVSQFLSDNVDWVLIDRLQLTPLDAGDGFFLAVLKAPEAIR
ncbi:MAG: RsmB/NOP family class I SAM-dependent RNA methyltransferase, partial [Boseongicola sp.]